jgi:hypothetical protein
MPQWGAASAPQNRPACHASLPERLRLRVDFETLIVIASIWRTSPIFNGGEDQRGSERYGRISTLDEVRANIDRLDRQIVSLLAERGGYVLQAARLKETIGDLSAPRSSAMSAE